MGHGSKRGGRLDVYNRFTALCTGNEHNSVNQVNKNILKIRKRNFPPHRLLRPGSQPLQIRLPDTI